MSAPNTAPNNIQLAQNWAPLLDEVYQRASVTSDLTSAPELARAGTNANEIVYPQVEVTGLGNYDRNSGYTQGLVDVKWVTTTFNYDRGSRISVDVMDNVESYNIAFAMGIAELMRTKVAPEADAFFFATLCGTAGITLVPGATITTIQQFMEALATANSQMDEDEVPTESRILYANPTLLNMIMELDSYKSKEILTRFQIQKSVPQSRFYSAVDLLDGKSAGEEAGHFKPSDDAAKINFAIIEKSALIKFDKHIVGDKIPAALNPDADADIYKYRKYGLTDVYKNKVAGIYISTQ